jgi:hypothetical protein
MVRLFSAVLSVLSAFPVISVADEREPRRMFVEAEMLRRAEVCEVGQKGTALEPLAKVFAWSFLDQFEKARQLKPLLPALSSLETLSSAQRAKLVRCLKKWQQAARIEQNILDEYPGSEVAFELARERRLTPSDIENTIGQVEAAENLANSHRKSTDERQPDQIENSSEPRDLTSILKDVEKEFEKSDQDDGASRKQHLTANQINGIRQQLAACWSPPVGARDSGKTVDIRVKLDRQGAVQSSTLMSTERIDGSFDRALAESAMNAVRTCSPLEGLPGEKYQAWKTLRLTFDPEEMLSE